MDHYKAAAIEDALEALHMGKTALRAGLEEISTWIRQRDSMNIHANVLTTLKALDLNASVLASAIEHLRS